MSNTKEEKEETSGGNKESQREAVQTLIEAVRVANKRGSFELKESAVIFNAVQTLEEDA